MLEKLGVRAQTNGISFGREANLQPKKEVSLEQLAETVEGMQATLKRLDRDVLELKNPEKTNEADEFKGMAV